MGLDLIPLILFIGLYLLLMVVAPIHLTWIGLLGGEPRPAPEPVAGIADDLSSDYRKPCFATGAVLYMLVLLALAHVRRSLFPAGAFPIGQEIAQNNRRQLLSRWT